MHTYLVAVDKTTYDMFRTVHMAEEKPLSFKGAFGSFLALCGPMPPSLVREHYRNLEHAELGIKDVSPRDYAQTSVQQTTKEVAVTTSPPVPASIHPVDPALTVVYLPVEDASGKILSIAEKPRDGGLHMIDVQLESSSSVAADSAASKEEITIDNTASNETPDDGHSESATQQSLHTDPIIGEGSSAVVSDSEEIAIVEQEKNAGKENAENHGQLELV
jgi:hypothetical protein